MKTFLTIFISLFWINSFGQNYIEYQKTFNRIDNDILSNNFSEASKRLDTIYNSNDFVYAKHCIKALQISCHQNDSINADKWLIKSFKQGVPLWIIRNNEITSKVFNYYQTTNTLKLYDSLNAIYKASINYSVSKIIDSLYFIDQKFTDKVNNGFVLLRHTIYGLQWLKNNKRQFNVIRELIEQYGFPGEKLIGLPEYYQDSLEAYKNVLSYGPSIEDFRVYVMLIHYFSNPRKDINDKLFESVKKGFIQPNQFGALNDFMAKWGKKKYGNYKFYNVWHYDSNKNNIHEINCRREKIGLSTFEEQIRNDEIYNGRRKNKTINKSIKLE